MLYRVSIKDCPVKSAMGLGYIGKISLKTFFQSPLDRTIIYRQSV